MPDDQYPDFSGLEDAFAYDQQEESLLVVMEWCDLSFDKQTPVLLDIDDVTTLRSALRHLSSFDTSDLDMKLGRAQRRLERK